jgi:hypothetical protein
MYSSTKDFIASAIDDFSSWGRTPPTWLNDNHRAKIFRVLSATLFFLLAIQLLWPLIERLFVLVWRKLRQFTSIQQVSKKIPGGLLPKDGQWELVANQINTKLKKIEGRPAEMKIAVSHVEATESGQYRWIPHVLAHSEDDLRTKLHVYLYFYFEGANAPQISRIRECKKHDPLTVRGTIQRADIYKYENRGWYLCVDVHYCTTIESRR